MVSRYAIFSNLMALSDTLNVGRMTSGNEDPVGVTTLPNLSKAKLFMPKHAGAPGKLGKTSSLAESLSKLRGKGALK